MKKNYITLILLFSLIITGYSQIIFEAESINMPGSWDSFSNPPSIDALRNPNQSPSGDITLITLGTRRYQTTIHCASSGGDVTPGTYDWLFTSGSNTSYYQNKWAGINVSMNSLQTYTHNTGLDNNITLADGKWYTVNFEDNDYQNTRAVFMETTGEPVDITGATLTLDPINVTPGDAEIIGLTVPNPINAELRIYVRYSDDSFTTSSVIELNQFQGSNFYVEPIPGSFNTLGKTVEYYFFTTTVDATTITDESAYDLITIDLLNNNGNNYFYTVGNLKSTNTFGTWENPDTWGGTVPETYDHLTIDDAVTIASDIDHTGNIVIDSPGLLIISPGNSLRFSGNSLTINTEIIISSTSNTYGSLIIEPTTNVSGTGQVEYFRSTNSNAAGNDLISPPVTGDTFGAFAARSSALFENPANTNEKLFGPFTTEAATPAYVNYVVGTDDDAEVLSAGRGYRAATKNAGNQLTFRGSTLQDDLTIPIINNGETDFKSWNLIGNPYSAYLLAGAEEIINNPDLDPNNNSLYVYNAGTSGTYPGGPTVTGDFTVLSINYLFNNSSVTLAPGQGFFVKAKTGGGSFQFREQWRRTATESTNTDDGIFGKSSSTSTISSITSNYARAKLQLNTSELTEVDLYFLDNATQGLDPGYDVGGFGGESGMFTHLLSDNSGVKMVIQSLPFTDVNDVIIPLGVKVNAGTEFSISLNNTFSELPDNINVYLEDTVENSFTLLNVSDYVRTLATDLNGMGRYNIVFTETTLSNIDFNSSNLLIYANRNSKTLEVKGELFYNTQLYVYDIHGRMVLQQELDANTSSNSITTDSLHTGVYIVQLKNELQYKTQKIIIE